MSGRGADRAAVVVGGGIGGLASARALQRAGWSVRVLEQAQRLEPLGAGISLWPNAMRALAALEVALQPHRADGWDERTASPGGIRSRSGRWLSRTDTSAYPSRYGAPLVALHRRHLQQALLTSLVPGTLVTGAQVTGVDARPDRVVVRHAGGESGADLVVLADGLTSAHRRLVTGPGPAPRFAGYTAWRCVTGPEAGLRHLEGATEYWGRGQRFGIVPLADGGTYWFATANTAEGDRAVGGEYAEVLRRFAGWHRPVHEVLLASDPQAVLRHDIYDLRPHPARYVSGRVVLLGDAAHAMTPNLGQGACLALEDAVTLGSLARPDGDLERALATYDGLRRPRGRLVARRSRQVGRLGQLQGGVTTGARDLLVRLLPDLLSDRTLDATVHWHPPGAPVPP